MISFRPLTSALAILLALPLLASAATPVECWDGSYATGSACPVRVISITPDLSPGSTDATATVNLAASADTLYVWVKEAVGGNCPTAPTVAQIISGTGSPDFHDDIASPSAGNNSVPVTGLTADTEYCMWAVASKNGIPSANASINSNAKTGSVPWFTSPVPGDLVKWNPGHYIQTPRTANTILSNTAATSFAAKKVVFDEFGDDENVAGFVVPYTWAQLEFTENNYAGIISFMRADLDYLKTLPTPKRLWVRMIDIHYGQTAINTATQFPPWLRNSSNLYVGANGSDVFWCRWNSALNDKYIDLIEAIADEFEDDPYFEAIYLYRETAAKIQNSPCGYTVSGYKTQSLRLHQEAKAAFPTTNVVFSMNYIGSNSTPSEIMAELPGMKVGIGSPDTLPEVSPYTCGKELQPSDAAFQGLAAAPGNVPRQGQIPSIWSHEVTAYSGALGNCTPAEIYAYTQEKLSASHIGWSQTSFNGTLQQNWASVRAVIDANPTTVSDCPSVYPGCLVGGE